MTKSRFEAIVRVTWESCRVQARGRVGHTVRGAWVAALLTALGAAILGVVGSSKTVWLAALTAALALFAACAGHLYALRLYASRHHRVDVLRLTFDEQGIRVLSDIEDSKIAYSDVIGIGRDAHYLMLRLRHHVPLVVGSGEVVGGKMDALVDFLRNRTGRDVRSLWS